MAAANAVPDRQENTERRDLDPIVPDDFVVPTEHVTAHFILRPLGPEHNAADHAAWTSSIDHIRATPGWKGSGGSWPDGSITLEENLRDLETHRRHFSERVGFTFTVLDPNDTEQVIGCVYIYDDQSGEHDAEVRSWVVADRAELDHRLWLRVLVWLARAWPFESVDYAPRPTPPVPSSG